MSIIEADYSDIDTYKTIKANGRVIEFMGHNNPRL